jgi:hypothetical protein
MNIREVPEGCPCGAALQTHSHIIAECPRYAPFRTSIREFKLGENVKQILGSVEGIAALTCFLQESGAFTKDADPPDPH